MKRGNRMYGHYGDTPDLRQRDDDSLLLMLPPLKPPLLDEVPHWALVQVSHPAGRRGPTYPDGWFRQVNFAGVPGAPPFGFDPYNGYSADSSGAFHQRALRKHAEKKLRRARKVAARKVVGQGCLREGDYRFFKGNLHNTYGYEATCRWCNARILTMSGLQLHLERGGCNRKLLAVYRFMNHAKPKLCGVCSAKTPSSRWGVPLCATEECLRKWKFAYPDSWKGLIQAKYAAIACGHLDDLGEKACDISRSM